MKNTKNIQHDVGFLLYNIPSPTVDYSKIAAICVQHLKHYMPNIPIAVCGQHVVGCDVHIPIKNVADNKRAFVHKGNTLNEIWYNLTRDRSLDVTPFERTVLLDSDYIVQSNQLQLLLECASPIMMYDRIFNIKENLVEVDYLGDSNVTLKWATVLAFDHSEISYELFSLWKKVITNYKYYALLYKWKTDGTVWNDKAITVALQQLTKYSNAEGQYIIPWCHPFASFKCDVDHIGLDKIVLSDVKGSYQVHTDVHILNKKSILHES